MLRNEFGGFNDAMYQLYQITGDARFLETARFFYHNEKIDPLRPGTPTSARRTPTLSFPNCSVNAANMT